MSEDAKTIVFRGGSNDGRTMRIPKHDDQVRLGKVLKDGEHIGDNPIEMATEYYRSSRKETEEGWEIFEFVR